MSDPGKIPCTDLWRVSWTHMEMDRFFTHDGPTLVEALKVAAEHFPAHIEAFETQPDGTRLLIGTWRMTWESRERWPLRAIRNAAGDC